MNPGAAGTPAPARPALLTTMDFPPTRGGIQTMAREIVERARRYSFHVVAPEDRAGEATVPDVPIRRVRARLAPGRRGYVPALTLATLAASRRDPRPVVGLSLHVLSAPGILVARLPLVVFTHGGELRSPRIRSVARRVLGRAARVVANSAHTRTAAIALGADPLRTTVVPVGAPDPTEVPAATIAALREELGGGRILLSVGRLAPHKGFDRLVRAVGSLPADVRLVIVGDGDERAALEALVRAAGVERRVVFAGSVEDAALPVYYAAADAFALLSRETAGGVEGGGIVLLEAFAAGLPVVAAASGGIPETVQDGETGLLADPDDPAAVARALGRIFEDRALADRLAAAGRAVATGERSWARSVERLEDVLDQAVAGRPS